MDAPAHLLPLLEPTPLGLLRLKTAWPSLSTTDKINLLTKMFAKDSPQQRAYWLDVDWFLDLALDDRDAYVRYLVASRISKPGDYGWRSPAERAAAETRYQKVLKDKDPLVRAACDSEGHGPFGFSILGSPEAIETFWSVEHPRRLTLIDSQRGNHGEDVAKAFVYAAEKLLPSNKVSLSELRDVLQQYLSSNALRQVVDQKQEHTDFFQDGYPEFVAGKDIEALWNAVPKLPPALQYDLLRVLPESAGMSENMAAAIADQLNEQMLATLLWRQDISLQDLRTKIFLESKNDELRAAALSHRYFQLPDAKISEFMYTPGESDDAGKAKLKQLRDLLRSCEGATLAQREALCYLVGTPEHLHTGFGPYDDLAMARDANLRRYRELDPTRRRLETFELRLFRLAKEVAPLGKNAPSEWRLKQITKPELVVVKNPWLSYINFKGAVTQQTANSVLGELPSGFDDDEVTETEQLPNAEPEPATPLLTTGTQEDRLVGLLEKQAQSLRYIFWLLVIVMAAVFYFHA